jgi:rubrerythrin
MQATDPRRKYGQFYIKVWGLRGSRWEEKTTRNLSAFEFSAYLREMAKRLENIASRVEANEREGGGVVVPPLPQWICEDCCEPFSARIPPREDYPGAERHRAPDCPACGEDTKVSRVGREERED